MPKNALFGFPKPNHLEMHLRALLVPGHYAQEAFSPKELMGKPVFSEGEAEGADRVIHFLGDYG